MKKPPVEHPFDRLSVRAWREEVAAQDLSDEELALQDTKARLEKDHKKALAGKIRMIIEKHCTKRQAEIFYTFMESYSQREAAKTLKMDESRVRRIVEKVRKVVTQQLNKATLTHK